ncbi:MAG TPA: deoxyhypusine synthase family protein [Dehalococcoidia bacterium]|nr:deoxyhypusine synthase family protein [Dehalococcoidia bacterium]
MDDLFHSRVRPFSVGSPMTAAQLLDAMGATAFQARNVARAARIWSRMLQDDTVIMFGLAGALVPAGMRPVIVYLIENHMIDVLVSTGANLFHDVYETLGKPHFQGSPESDDHELGRRRINRFYDVLAPESDFSAAEEFITQLSYTLDRTHPYTTREYFRTVGDALIPVAQEEGILTAAARHGVPVYSPALGDSVHGLAIAFGRARSDTSGPKRAPVLFDIIGDVLETAHIAATAPATGVIYVGGGTPKNFIQQAEVGGYIFQRELPGHKYAVQITMDQPQWGGLSGCTFEEAQSWRKIAPDATMVTVNVEATVALPLIVTALAEGSAGIIKNRRPPEISLEGMPGAWRRSWEAS